MFPIIKESNIRLNHFLALQLQVIKQLKTRYLKNKSPGKTQAQFVRVKTRDVFFNVIIFSIIISNALIVCK